MGKLISWCGMLSRVVPIGRFFILGSRTACWMTLGVDMEHPILTEAVVACLWIPLWTSYNVTVQTNIRSLASSLVC